MISGSYESRGHDAKKQNKQMKHAQRFDEQKRIDDDDESSHEYGGHECSIELNEGKLEVHFCDIGRLFGF